MDGRFASGPKYDVERRDSMTQTLRPRPSPPTSRRLGSIRQGLLIFILLVGLMFSSIDASIVSTALVSISGDLQDFRNAPWVIQSYLLAYMSFAVAFAKMSDVFGRRAMVLLSWILFMGFSLGCGLARSMDQLIVFRALQGLGASGLYSLAQISMVEIGPADRPSLVGAMIGMTLAVSFVLGPVLGGTISQFSNWRWIFLINVPFGVFSIAGILLAWPRPRGIQLDIRQGLRSLDWLGNVTLLAASSLLVFPLQQAGSLIYTWDSPVITASFSLAAMCWIIFAAWETVLGLRYIETVQALFPPQLITQRVYLAALLCTMCTGYSYLAVTVSLPERFQIVNGDSTFMAGIHLLPLLGGTAFGSFLAGALSSKRNNTSMTLIASSCFQLLGIGLLTTLSNDEVATRAQYGYQSILGLGVGLAFGSATIISAILASHSTLAVAQGAMAQARVFGGAIGIAVSTITFNLELQQNVASSLAPEQLEALHRSPLAVLNWSPSLIDKVRTVYTTAFTDGTRTMVYVCAASVLISLFSYQKNPPAISEGHHKVDLESLHAGTSETELDDMGSVRSDIALEISIPQVQAFQVGKK